MSNVASTYLKYAHLQMASEAFLVDRKTGQFLFTGEDLELALMQRRPCSSIRRRV